MADKPTNNTRVTNNVMENSLMRQIRNAKTRIGRFCIDYPNYNRYASEADHIYSLAMEAGIQYMTRTREKKVSSPEVDKVRNNCLIDLKNLEEILRLQIRINNISINVKNTQYLKKAQDIIKNIFTESITYRKDVLSKIRSKSKNNMFAQNEDVVIRNKFNEMIEKAKADLIEIIGEIQYKIAQQKINAAYPPIQPAAGGKRKTRRAKKNTRSRK